MGGCIKNRLRDQSQKQTGCESEQYTMFTSIKSHIQYFDQIDLELLQYPDISLLLRKHIKNFKIIEEGKTWLVISEVQKLLKEKIPILIRNYNTETDAALQLISSFQQLVPLTTKILEYSVTFDEEKVDQFQYFQNQLVQISLECLIIVNTLNQKKQKWWSDDYFSWRTNHIKSTFSIAISNKSKVEIIGSVKDFIHLLMELSKKFGIIQFIQGTQDESKVEQEFLHQFYNQMKIGFIQGSSFSESVANEVKSQTKEISNNIQCYTLIINKK